MSDELRFKWDELKRHQTIPKHAIDFDDAVKIFQNTVYVSEIAHLTEDRKIAIGFLGDMEIAVIFTFRDGFMRIITARRARVNERRNYHEYLLGRGAEDKGQN